MPTNLKRVSFYAEPELVEKLERWHAETGASVSEILRRALRSHLSIFASPHQGKLYYGTPVEMRSTQPVLLRPEESNGEV